MATLKGEVLDSDEPVDGEKTSGKGARVEKNSLVLGDGKPPT